MTTTEETAEAEQQGAGPEYPPDLQAALEQVYATARPFTDSEVAALRAALNIALQYVKKPDPVRLDPMVVLVEAGTVTMEPLRWWEDDPELVEHAWPEDRIVLVCPHCWRVADWTYAVDGTEYRRFYADDLLVSSDTDEFNADGDFGLVCGRCYERCSVPQWLWDAGMWEHDGPDGWV